MARDPAAAGPEHMMTSIRPFAGPLMIVCALLGAGHALAADEFPFDRELLLDAAPMRPGKRMPVLNVAPDGNATIGLWCKTVTARVEISDAAIKIEPVGDHRFGGDQQAGDRGRVLQRHAHDLGRVDDAGLRSCRHTSRSGRRSRRCRLLLQQLADHDRAFDAGILGDLADRGLQRAAHDVDAGVLVVVVAGQPGERLGGSRATPPPGTMPSSTAARVALSASSTRSLRSLTSTSVAPPTRITATPPASLARRSCSFSLS
jgi:hypothetical protein